MTHKRQEAARSLVTAAASDTVSASAGGSAAL